MPLQPHRPTPRVPTDLVSTKTAGHAEARVDAISTMLGQQFGKIVVDVRGEAPAVDASGVHDHRPATGDAIRGVTNDRPSRARCVSPRAAARGAFATQTADR